MFNRFTIVCLVLGICELCSGQYQKSSKDAAILSEARYLQANGQFGSAYTQEDGVEFKEESDGSGNRRGTYSYVDPTGQRRTVSYTAGKDGFRATGDHLPVAPAPAPVPTAPTVTAVQQPQQFANSRPDEYEDSGEWKDDTSDYDGRYSNAIPQQPIQYNPAPAPQQFARPTQFSNPDPRPIQFQYQSPSSYQDNSFNPTTNPPHRFFPPGKLNINRSPDGFSYTFNKS